MANNYVTFVNMGGIDLAEANCTVVEGLYDRLVTALEAGTGVVLFNWWFSNIMIPPSHCQVVQLDDEIRINELIQVTELDEVTVLGIEPPPPPLEPVIPLEVTENGVYEIEEPQSGYNPVTVAVPIPEPLVLAGEFYGNGIYYPPEGYDGYSSVVVNVDVDPSGYIEDALNWFVNERAFPVVASGSIPSGYSVNYSNQYGTSPAWCVAMKDLIYIENETIANVRWTAPGGQEQWVELVFDEEKRINAFVISSVGSSLKFCKEFKVEAYVNDSYVQVFSGEMPNLNYVGYKPIQEVICTKFKLTVINSYTSYSGIARFCPVYLGGN